MRSDYPALWQLSGPWNDVPHFNIPGACIAYTLYISGSLAALLSARRPLRAVEAIGLICIPFAFNLLITMGADWHMGEIGSFLTPGFNIPFPYKVVIGRAVVLFGVGELFLEVLAVIGAARLETNLRLHVILLVAAALGAATPMLANTAQWAVDPLAAVVVGSALAAAAQACLWSLVYIVTGLALDMMGGRPPSLTTAWGHWRAGFVKGAIYGGVFMAIILAAAALLKAPGALPFIKSQGLATGLIAGAALWPLGQTIVGSADGTPPFFGRLAGAYRDVKTYVRGAIIGFGVAGALSTDLAASDGGTRFLIAFALGAVAFAGVELLFDALRIARGERTKVQTWRLYALQALLGGLVGGALGWYFDVSQLQVVVNKFWAYADANYRASGRALGDFTTYPLFNKYGSINLGEVAGGVRLFWAESLSGVINWSIAAPLFSINYVLLSALLTRSLSPIVGLFTALGLEGLAEQAVRVMRWGLWMAPVINSFLRQSPDPTWYDQDGAVRTLVASAWDLGLPGADFRANSLMIFTGLLAYDWLRVLIWFDHMGLRVATLVNLTFLGGDRADEAAARFLGYGGRTRAIPDGIRRFATWTPLLIPFFIPRGAEWDKAWTGGEQLAKSAAALPGPIHTMAIAYSIAGAFIALGAAAVIV